jgi:hypothetical protein
MELSINMGRPFSSGAYSTTEPDGKPDAAPSDAIVDKVPILHKTRNGMEKGMEYLHKLEGIWSYQHHWKLTAEYDAKELGYRHICLTVNSLLHDHLTTSSSVRASSAKSRRAAFAWW